MKKYYLPPVLESNAKKGYIVPDHDAMLAALLAYVSTRVKTKGFIFKKAAEKLTSMLTIYYPIDIKCIDKMKGGEIFVPKLPSMRIIDLANAIAPNSKKNIIGIRAGEKIHEILLTEDEARHS